MDRITKIKEWIKNNPQDVVGILTATALVVQIAYLGYSVSLDHHRKVEVRRYRRAFEGAVASGKDVRVLPNGTVEIIEIKKK